MKDSLKSGPANRSNSEIVGLIPAGGRATRIAPLPCSKELLPIGFHVMSGNSDPRPKVVSQYLLEKLQLAGITKTYIVLRKGKWDIPNYFGHGDIAQMHLAYLIMGETYGPPFTIDQAYPFVHDKLVAFGFPDIIMSPKDIFGPLLDKQAATQSDAVLAIFPAHNTQIMDMVEIDENGQVHAMFLKPDETELRLCWLCAVWTPVFTQYMHEYLEWYRKTNEVHQSNRTATDMGDVSVGFVIQAAIEDGVKVYGVPFPDGKYLDIGTPADLVKSVALYGHLAQ